MNTNAERMLPHDLVTANGEQRCEIANRLADLYVSFRGRYTMFRDGQTFIPKTKSDSAKLTDRVIFGHAMREYAIGVFGGAKASKFVCFDVDDGSRETVCQLIAAIEVFGIPRELVYVSTSGGKGYHVEVFFEPFAYADQLRTFYRWVIEYGGFDSRYVEFRPTHKQSVKLPLSLHPRTGNVCWYVDRETLEPIQSAEYVLSIEKLPSEIFDQLTVEKGGDTQNADGKKPDKTASKSAGLFDVLDPSGISYRPLTDSGQRHNMMVGIAVHQRKTGAGRNECERTLENWYRDQSVDLMKSQAHEVMRDISDITAWVYGSKFNVHGDHQKQQALIRRCDMQFVTDQKTKSARKLLFLLVARREAGLMKLSQHRMAEVIGVAPATVFNLLQEFTELGAIEKVKGRRRVKDGRFTADSDTCLVNKPENKGSDQSVAVGMRELIDNFGEVYYRTIHDLLGGTELGYMTAGERKEYGDYLENTRKDGETEL